MDSIKPVSRNNMKNFLKKFKGKPLSNDQVTLGMHLCFCNAKELLEDAEILKKNRKYARALSLAMLSLEELAKVPMLANTLLYPKNAQRRWKNFWTSFTSHPDKQLIWSIYGEFLKKVGITGYEDKYPSSLVPLLEKFKQLGFYVNFFDNKFIKPDDFAKDNPEWIKWIFEITRKRIDDFSHLHSSLDDSKRVIKLGKDIIRAFINAKNKDEFTEAFKIIVAKIKKK